MSGTDLGKMEPQRSPSREGESGEGLGTFWEKREKGRGPRERKMGTKRKEKGAERLMGEGTCLY